MTNAKPRGAAQADTKKGLTDQIRDFFASKGEESMGAKFLFRLTALAVAMAMVVLGAGVALADQITADADISAAAGAGSASNSVTANQAEGTTVAYPISALIKRTGQSSDDVFRTAGDKVTVSIQRSGDWVNATDPGTDFVDFTAYDTSQSASVRISVPACTTAGVTKRMDVTLTGDATNNGSISSDTLDFTITASAGSSSCTPSDTTAPQTSITSTGPTSTTNSTSASFTFESSESNSSFQCSLDDAAFTSCASPKAYTNLADGTHTFAVKAVDGSGNTDATPDSRTWTIDSTAPGTTVNSGPSTFTNDRTATLGFNSDDATATFECQLDEGAWSSCTSAKTYSSLTDGWHTFKVRASDAASNVDASPAEYSWAVDTIAPSISATGATKGTGATATTYTADTWTNLKVTVSFACTDNTGGSGTSSTIADVVKDEDFEGNLTTPASGCVDAAGNTATAQGSFGPVKIDKFAPTITAAATTGTGATLANYSGDWTNQDVKVTFSCTDSGPSGLPADYSDEVQYFTTNQNATTATSANACTDRAGNSATSASFNPIKIDKDAPTDVTFVGGPESGGTYYFGGVPSAPTCTANDTLSLLTSAGCRVAGHSTAVGSHTLTATAQDNAGNITTATRSYRVSAWTLSGFYNPVDMGGVTNVVKAGSTVPLKFEVFAGTAEFISTDVVETFTVTRKTCGALTGATDAIENYSTGGTSLRYDETGGQFIQNWKVPSGSNICYEVVLTTDDGSSQTAYFKTK